MASNSIAVEYRTFIASYNFDGARWNLEIAARDEEEARQRLNRIAFAKIDGEVMAKVKLPDPSSSTLVRRIVAAIFGSRLPR